MSSPGNCPDCGARLAVEPWASGLCLTCLLELGLTERPDGAARPPASTDLPTIAASVAELAPGQVLGNRYRIRSLLGSGGMGEVYRAFDVKLRVDVALKAVRTALLANPHALDALRQEVRSAREVVSPNVCRVFDLVEIEGRELVSMEFIDGMTLADMLRERSPLTLQESRDIAAQFLAGLEAIHGAGLVHRDIKPENLMLTRAGRVVVMDFGIARAVAHVRGGTVSGTPAYMAPEQAHGEPLDARADIFSAAVVLAEMVFPGGVRSREARDNVWRRLREEPPALGEIPWAAVIRKALARLRDDRYPSASSLSRALEEVTLRTTGDEAKRPYPGLAAFTEQDADYFVGRELEIEEMWKKLRRRHLLALIGPSGAGKSSLLRAGLGTSTPAGWRIIFTTPGDRPFAALAHALAPELAADVAAVARLIDFEQPEVAVDVITRWRRRHEQALLVVDQFEELFTQSAGPVQERFAQLLMRIALEADVRVLLSMRDDFLFQCHRIESLSPVFSEVTAIGPPAGAALRRALVQPALKCGYRFEDETVVEEMLAQVSGERGALPLAAFAMARLWEARDREKGLLTRVAYERIGGVGGALAQHAESTLDGIGHERLPIVRELFRNLVTSQGTRATVDREELLSVFADAPQPDGARAEIGQRRRIAERVLDALIDARLLTSYEIPDDEQGHGARRIEVIHESLLSAWPRLVRWQTQDRDGAQLRDQLRQAARLWEERGHPEDLLWTGTSFREYELWRERYEGKLSSGEDAFTRAMTSRALRKRRQRLLGVAALVTAAVAVAIAMSVMWRRSEAARGEALTAARHAEAQQLFALGQLEIDRNPTAALAYALASLERQDSAHARQFALRALWRGPTAFRLAKAGEDWDTTQLRFSRDARWLATMGTQGDVRVWKNDGSPPRYTPGTGPRGTSWMEFAPDNESLIITGPDAIRFHALVTGKETRRIPGTFRWGLVRGAAIFTGSFLEPTHDGRPRRLLKKFSLPGGEVTTLGVWTALRDAGGFDIDADGRSMFSVYDGDLYDIPLDGIERSESRRVVDAEKPIAGFVVSPDGERIFTWDPSGAGHVWSRATGGPVAGPHLVGSSERSPVPNSIAISPDGQWLAAANGDETVSLWNLRGPAGVEPLVLPQGARSTGVAIDPTGSWMAVQDHRGISMIPLTTREQHVLRAPAAAMRGVAIDPGGRWIAAMAQGSTDGWIWPLRTDGNMGRYSVNVGGLAFGVNVSPTGDALAVSTFSGVWLVQLDGRPIRKLPGFNGMVMGAAFDRDGGRLAAGGGLLGPLMALGESHVRVWNLETGEVQILDARDGVGIGEVAFLPDGRLISSGLTGLRIWDLATATWTQLADGVARAVPSPDGRYILGLRALLRPGGAVGRAFVYDLRAKRARDLPTHGTEVTTLAWHPSSTHVVTGGRDGTIRVGPLDGGEPHLFLGHEGPVWGLAMEPGGRWFASTAEDGTVRTWPMRDGPPLHTLPLDKLLDRLRSLTNYRVMPDPSSASGYRIDFEPFKGWNRPPPTW